MATSIGPTYDPASTAAALAEKYTSSRQQILTAQTTQATAAGKALSTLNSAILGYQASLSALTGINKTMLSQSATFADTSIGSATASASATAGSYSFFVEQLATAHQVSYSGLPDNTPAAGAGSLSIKAGLTPFTVNLGAAGVDADGNGTLSVREMAAAINGAAGNAGQVSAAVVTIGATTQLVLTAKNTGIDNSVSVDGSGLATGPLKTALAAAPAEVVAAKNAIVWLGAKTTGTKIEQASNTFTNIDGVKMTFTRAQAASESPVTLTVAGNNAGTIANVQAFIDSYNKLKAVVDSMVAPGDPESGAAGGVFAHDSGVRALQASLVSLLRNTTGGSLAAYGITASREGLLTLKAERLTSQLALDPDGLDTLIGRTSSTGGSGIAGKVDTYLKQWSGTNGQLVQRKEFNGKLQTQLTKRQDLLDSQYDNAYKRYLLQFTQLQTLQSQMSSNTSMFDALFGDKSN